MFKSSVHKLIRIHMNRFPRTPKFQDKFLIILGGELTNYLKVLFGNEIFIFAKASNLITNSSGRFVLSSRKNKEIMIYFFEDEIEFI